MYVITTWSGDVLHNPMLSSEGRIVINPVLTEQLNTHGSLTFSIAPTHPMYNSIAPRQTNVRVICDVDNGAPDWFGRVISVRRGMDNCKEVYCEGELAFLLDAIYQPFGFKGAPADLFASFLSAYRGTGTRGPMLFPGNVSAIDPNNFIVRSSKNAQNVWDMMGDKLFNSSLGGYVLARYERSEDKHYVDYLRLSADDPYAHVSSQVVRFGENLLNFVQSRTAENVITALIPYGAEFVEDDSRYEDGPPDNGRWNGNRLTVYNVNNNSRVVKNQLAIAIFGMVCGVKIWDDVTLARNLLRKAQDWLASQTAGATTIECNAVDLAFAKADIEQIRLGDFVRVVSEPHDLDEMLLCTHKQTYLADAAQSTITLGHPEPAISDVGLLSQDSDNDSVEKSLQNTKVIVTSYDSTDTLSGYTCQSAFVTEDGKLYVISRNARYRVYDLNITSGSKIVVGSMATGVPLNMDIGHANSACYSNGLAYVSHWDAAAGNPEAQNTNGGLIHVFSVDSANNAMTYLRDIQLPTVAGRRTEHYVYPGEDAILSLGWEYRSSSNSKYMILTLWEKGSDGTYVQSWERKISGVNVAQGMNMYKNKLYLIDNNYEAGVGYSHRGIMIIDLATGLQKLDESQTGEILNHETEQIIPLSNGRFLIVGGNGWLYNAQTS